MSFLLHFNKEKTEKNGKVTLGSIKKHIPLNPPPSAGHEIPGTDEEIVHPAIVEAQPPTVILVYLQQRQTARTGPAAPPPDKARQAGCGRPRAETPPWRTASPPPV